tara:strand:+ start:4887 stop:5939 length:1053 start_codon:yes stop_codon:yes gene_type:complete
MSNSYTSPPLLTDPARLTAGLTIRSTEFNRLGDAQNYAFAQGGCGEVINQFWDSGVFEFTNTSTKECCEWHVPNPSEEHTEFKFRISASCNVSGAVATVSLKFPLSGNSYTSTATITDTSRFNNVFDVVTINITTAEDELYATCKLSLQAPSGGTIEVAAVQANWLPIASPLPTRLLGQYGANVTPMGITRLGDDQSLTSRFGVETLNNISEIRKRGRVLLNWSGVKNSSSSPAQGVGSLDPQILYNYVALFAGMNHNNLDVDVFIKGENITTPINVDVFGYRLSVTLSDWNSYGLDLRLPESDFSNQFGLSMYRVGVDETLNNASTLLSKDNPIGSSPAYIRGISIVGV